MLDDLVHKYGPQTILGVGLGLSIFYAARVAYAMREGVRWLLRAVGIAGCVWLGALALGRE